MKPEFFKHADLFDAEQSSRLPLRLAFAALWTVADRAGRFVWRPRELKLDCLPYDACDFAAVLDALERAGFIRSYVVDGKRYGVIDSFPDHQTFHQREAQSKIPAPPEKPCIAAKASPPDDAPTAGIIQGSSPDDPRQPVSISVSVSDSISVSVGDEAVSVPSSPSSPPAPDLAPADQAVYDDLLIRLGGGYVARQALAEFFAYVGARAVSWLSILVQYLDGPLGDAKRKVPPDRLLLAVIEFNIKRQPNTAASPQYFAGFLRDAMSRPEITPEMAISTQTNRLLSSGAGWDEYDRVAGIRPATGTNGVH